jgi:hypothetical protein
MSSPHNRLEIGVVQSEQAKRFVQAPHHHHLAVADVQLALRILAIKLVDFVLGVTKTRSWPGFIQSFLPRLSN